MHQTGKLEVNGAKLYYEVRGEGHPLVLAHAGIADSRMWDDQMDAFSQRYQVIRYDFRGCGQSEIPPEPYSLNEDLYGLLRALGVSRAHLIGVSMSGAMVVDFTLTHPEMVTALIPVASGLSGFGLELSDLPPEEAALEEEAEAAAEAGDFARANDLEVHIWVDGPRRTPDQVNPTVRERVREMNGLIYSRWEEQKRATHRRMEPPAAGRLAEIHAPTLVIVGDQDLTEVQLTTDALAAGIPGARKAVIPNAAHVPNMERPDEFNRIVLDFLASL